MKYRAAATITLLVATVFEDDGVHEPNEQAIAALDVEAQCCYCLKPGEFKLNGMEVQKIGMDNARCHRQPRRTRDGDNDWSR